MTRSARLTLALLAAALLLPGLPAAAQEAAQCSQTPLTGTVVYERCEVPALDGTETLRVEIVRDTAVGDAPVILTYSPYTIIGDALDSGQPANDTLAGQYVPQGYARALGDVLGTRGSSGCWDYGGLDEQQSGVDLVNWLAAQPWSNGNVGMIGGSYDGTTATMVAARGGDAPGLKAIVPIVGISRWYGYAWSSGVRYFLNTDRPTDEGFDTPLAFDFGFGRVPPVDYTHDGAVDAALDRTGECGSIEHTERGYLDPDYDEFWLERDYRKDAADFRAAVLVAHAWQDYNVKQEEGVKLFEALPVDDPSTPTVDGVPFKRLYVYQGGHRSPSGERWTTLLADFFAQTLKGEDTGVDDGPPVLTEGRTFGPAGAPVSTGFRTEATWPPVGATTVPLYLGRDTLAGGTLSTGRAAGSTASYTDTSTTTEEAAKLAPATEASWLYYASPPLASDVRLAGDAVLDLRLTVDRDSAHATPVLVDVAPGGQLRTISRGFVDLQYRNTLAEAQPVPVGTPVRAQVVFKPQDQTIQAGHRIGVLVQSSNTAWAVPDTPGATVTVHHGARTVSGRLTLSRLLLPLVNPPATLFGQ
ncbi:MAG: CocE/NonD family hydrolase [Egibacteraceae bacterium]